MECLKPRNMIGQARVLEILPADIMELLAPVIGSHSIHHDCDKPEFGQMKHSHSRHKRFGNVRIMWACINVFDNGVTEFGIKDSRSVNHTVDVRFSVASYGHKPFGKAEPEFQ